MVPDTSPEIVDAASDVAEIKEITPFPEETETVLAVDTAESDHPSKTPLPNISYRPLS